MKGLLRLLTKVWAFLVRDFLSDASYRLAFVLQLAGMFFAVALFYYGSRMVNPQTEGLDGVAPFPWLLVGIAFQLYFSTALYAFAAKVRSDMEAMRLRKLFEFVGDQLGISVEVVVTDGRQPIGTGIGPVLEARDVMAVLNNEPDAPKDLREKSLQLAARLLECDPQIRGGGGYARARELLENGEALKKMQRIIDAQGPSNLPAELGALTTDIVADKDGVLEGIDCLRLNRLARMAGAPVDKGAGITVFKKIGERVEAGEPLYRIYACENSEFELVSAAAKSNSGFAIDGEVAVTRGTQ